MTIRFLLKQPMKKAVSNMIVGTDYGGGDVITPLSFVSQPQSKTVDEYSLATFSCEVTGGVAPYSYQWKKNGINLGANSAALSFTAAAADKNASITVVVVDNVGTVVISTAAVLGVIVSRNFTTFDPVLQTHMTMQTAKVMTDYEVIGLVYLDGINEVRLFGNLVDFNSRLYVSPAGSIDFRPAAASSTSLTAYNGSVPLYKLSAVKVRRVGATGYIYVNNVLVSSGAVPTGASNITIIGKNYTSNSGGVLADVIITDLTTPSNSESWKLDRPIGTNTEQSSSGNNLLTYVNATKREKFTKVGNDWLGQELWHTRSWLSTAPENWSFHEKSATSAGIDSKTFAYKPGILSVGEVALVKYSLIFNSGTCFLSLSNGFATKTHDTSGSFETVGVNTANESVYFGAGPNSAFTVSNVSVKRILEVA